MLGVQQQTGYCPAAVAGKLTVGVSTPEGGRMAWWALPREPRIYVPDPPFLPSDLQLPVYTNVTWKEISLDCDLYLGSSTRSTLSRLLLTHVPSGHGGGGEASFRFKPLYGEPNYGCLVKSQSTRRCIMRSTDSDHWPFFSPSEDKRVYSNS